MQQGARRSTHLGVHAGLGERVAQVLGLRGRLGAPADHAHGLDALEGLGQLGVLVAAAAAAWRLQRAGAQARRRRARRRQRLAAAGPPSRTPSCMLFVYLCSTGKAGRHAAASRGTGQRHRAAVAARSPALPLSPAVSAVDSLLTGRCTPQCRRTWAPERSGQEAQHRVVGWVERLTCVWQQRRTSYRSASLLTRSPNAAQRSWGGSCGPHSLHKLLVEHIGVQVQLDGRRHPDGAAAGAGSPQGRRPQHIAGGAGHSLSGNAAGSHGGAGHVARRWTRCPRGRGRRWAWGWDSRLLRAVLAAKMALAIMHVAVGRLRKRLAVIDRCPRCTCIPNCSQSLPLPCAPELRQRRTCASETPGGA